MQAKLGGEVGNRTGSQDACVTRAPSAVCFKILALPAVGVVNAAVEAPIHPRVRSSTDRGISVSSAMGLWLELPPADRIEVAEQAGGLLVPTPPEVAREGPQTLMHGRNETVEGTGFAYDWSHLRGGLGEHLNFIFSEDAGLDGLHYENTLQDAAIDQGNTEEGLVRVLARFAEVFETRMVHRVLDGNGAYLLGHEASKASLVESHAERPDARGTQSEGRSEHEIRSIWLQQVCRTDVRRESLGDQCNDICEGFGRLASFRREVTDFLQRQNKTGIRRKDDPPARWSSFAALGTASRTLWSHAIHPYGFDTRNCLNDEGLDASTLIAVARNALGKELIHPI